MAYNVGMAGKEKCPIKYKEWIRVGDVWQMRKYGICGQNAGVWTCMALVYKNREATKEGFVVDCERCGSVVEGVKSEGGSEAKIEASGRTVGEV